MARTVSFDNNTVGKGSGDYFKITGVKERPQRIALIPGEAFQQELVISDALRAKAKTGDQEAREKMEEISALAEDISRSLKKHPPSAEIWTNENGQKVMLYARVEAANVFWVDGVGYVYDKPDVPEECKGKRGVTQLYGCVICEYEVNEDGPRFLAEDQQIDLEDGHKLRFRYGLKVAQFNDPVVKAWKDHTRSNPFISCDFEVWNEKQGQYTKTKFSPAGTALWRENPAIMRKIIVEARKLFPNVRKNLAKDYSREEIIKCFPDVEAKLLGGKGLSDGGSNRTTMDVEETDFSKLLGESSAPAPTTETAEQAPAT